jgi:peptide/nickel transport system substrate-binding protein
MSPTDADFGYLDYAGTDNDAGRFFDDIRVRQAICQAIDKQQVLDLVYSGDGQVTYGPILPQFTNWALTEELVPYDLAEAAKLMAAAGVDEIQGPMMWASSSPQSDQIGEIIKEQLSKINVITDLQPMETAAYYNVTYAYRYTFSHHVPLNSPEPDENLASYFGETATYFKHYDPAIFDLVKKQAETVDFEERKAVVKEAQEKIVLAYPIRFMFTTNVHQFIDNTLKDYEISLDRYDNYAVETAWLDA